MTKSAEPAAAPEPTGLALLRRPFPDHQISKLPKPMLKREDMDKLPKGQCSVCGRYHATSKIMHLDYVGHAALTDRLLDADPEWQWEPVAMAANGLPAFDAAGGMWIKLTVCGVTRLGYGHAGDKKGGDAIKEIIGDALRNAAMRFGAALDLWHKGDLHAEPEEPTLSALERAIGTLRAVDSDKAHFTSVWNGQKEAWKALLGVEDYLKLVEAMKQIAAAFPKDPPPPDPPAPEPEPDPPAKEAFELDDSIPF